MQCLHSIRSSKSGDLKIGVWVVDNASVDGTVHLLETAYPDVHLIKNTYNQGFATANNQAIREMDAEFVLLLNPDTVLQEETLHTCYQFMKDHPMAGAMGVRMIDGSGKFLPESKRQIPGIWNSFCKLSYLSLLFPRSRWFSGYNLGYLPEFEIAEVDVLCGAFMFMRKQVLDRTGLLDEAFFMYGEDIDLSYRILQSGYKIYYNPSTSIIHYKGESTKKNSFNYVRTFYGAMHTYVKKHYSSGTAAAISRMLNVAISARMIISGMSRVLDGWIRPMIDFAGIHYGLILFSDFWALYKFNQTDYYAGSILSWSIPVYAFVLVFAMWLAGNYDKNRWSAKNIIPLLGGTAAILLGYALLPETMRTSRAMILFGIMVATVVHYATFVISRWLKYGKAKEAAEGHLAIVANSGNADKLKSLLIQSGYNEKNIYLIAPEPGNADVKFTAESGVLPTLIKPLGITEIIYNPDDTGMKLILESMAKIGDQTTYRIGNADTLDSSSTPFSVNSDRFYKLDRQFALSKPYMLRLKRIFDVVTSIIFLPLMPVLVLITGGKVNVAKNIIQVLFGLKTWVGYGGAPASYEKLPEIHTCIIPYPFARRKVLYTEKHCIVENHHYATGYSVFEDLKIVWSNLHRVGNV